MFFGVYQNWGEALEAARAFGAAGYDNAASASLYEDRVRLDTYDYPALYWVYRSMTEGMRSVFDVGGATGIKFHAFREPLSRFPQLRWCVQDVPAMVENGRRLAQRQQTSRQLTFTADFSDGDGVDLLLASGVLQYLAQTLGELLEGYEQLPRRIVVNTTPIHPQHEFFTVNSIGTAFCPYRVQTHANLVRGLAGLGYRVRETWTNPDKRMNIPFHPEHCLRTYSGACFDLQ